MQPTIDDLKRAFYNSDLPRLGYTFEGAMRLHTLALCLERLAAPKKKPAPTQAKPLTIRPAKVVKKRWYHDL